MQEAVFARVDGLHIDHTLEDDGLDCIFHQVTKHLDQSSLIATKFGTALNQVFVDEHARFHLFTVHLFKDLVIDFGVLQPGLIFEESLNPIDQRD